MANECPKCQTENTEDSQFCKKCATPLQLSKDIGVTITIETPVEEYLRGSTFANRFKIIEKLGTGGMGTVFRVEDTNIGQDIALKLIKSDIASEKKTIERFRNELKTTRMISHRNVCRMFDLAETEGTFYITMEYVSGEDLKSFIRRSGKLDIPKAISIAKEVCEGLGEAHRLSVVHRDLKSNNIMIDKEGHARIMDFGIASSIITKGLTGEGIIIGTPEYMSPEQADAKGIDHRSDIYSLGVILYEMVTGELPFEEDTPLSIAMKHKGEIPRNPQELNTQIPDDLSGVILKCLEKDKESRFQSAYDVRTELIRIEKGMPATERNEPKKKHLASKEITLTVGVRRLLLPVLFVIIFVISALIIWNPWKQQESSAIPPSGKPSIAVLPFIDLSPQKDQGYFCDGMAEALLNALTSIKDLRVAARTSSFSFKGKEQDIREIGKRLNVKTVLEGSVRKAAEQLRISVQLISIADGFQLWSKQYDRKIDDVFAIQDEIALNIVQALNLELSEEEKDILGKSTTENVQAYEFYIKGRDYFHQRTHRSQKLAIELFSQAIRKDPGYALAYAGMSECYGLIYMYYDRNKENLDQALAASQEALDLDPELAEAHVSRGLAISQNMEYEEAEKEFESAIRLNPKLFDAYYMYARTLRVQGKHKQAARLFEQASQIRPEDYDALTLLIQAYDDLGQKKEASMANQRIIEVLKKHVELNPDDSRAFNLGALAFYREKDEKMAIEWMERAVSLEPGDTTALYNAACLYSKMGMTEEALNYFESSIESGFSSKEWIENDSDLDQIRNHPRFQEIIKKLK